MAKRRVTWSRGHYFDSNTHLKVKVEIAHPLLADADSAVESGRLVCVFGRIIFVLRIGQHVSALTDLKVGDSQTQRGGVRHRRPLIGDPR